MAPQYIRIAGRVAGPRPVPARSRLTRRAAPVRRSRRRRPRGRGSARSRRRSGRSTASTHAAAAAGGLPNATWRATRRSRRTAARRVAEPHLVEQRRRLRPRGRVDQQVVALRRRPGRSPVRRRCCPRSAARGPARSPARRPARRRGRGGGRGARGSPSRRRCRRRPSGPGGPSRSRAASARWKPSIGTCAARNRPLRLHRGDEPLGERRLPGARRARDAEQHAVAALQHRHDPADGALEVQHAHSPRSPAPRSSSLSAPRSAPDRVAAYASRSGVGMAVLGRRPQRVPSVGA